MVVFLRGTYGLLCWVVVITPSANVSFVHYSKPVLWNKRIVFSLKTEVLRRFGSKLTLKKQNLFNLFFKLCAKFLKSLAM
jgi:hypothetical protein